MTTNTLADRAQIMRYMRLSSAIRVALACAIVGGTAIYGPKCVRRQIKFPSFAYLTAMLVVSDASLGDTLKGCWHAFCATAMVVPLAMLWWWIIGPMAALPSGFAALTVAVAAFLVALLDFTHLTTKKIAFGQIVLVCTNAAVNGGSSDRFMQPLHIATATALGVFASVLAWLVPYPNLATYEVHELYRIYAENASQRMKIYLTAFNAVDEHTKMELISQAKPLSETGSKLLQSLRILQEGMQWERPWRRVSPGKRLERMEQQMRGIEYSLLSSPVFPIHTTHHEEEQRSKLLDSVSARLTEKIRQVSSYSPYNSLKESETRESIEKPSSLPLESTFPINKQGWVFFYFSCIDMVLSDTFTAPNEFKTHCSKTEFSIITTLKTWIQKLTCQCHERLKFSFKCSLSLSLAVLCGLLFDKENGCWAGLTIAISFVTGRQAIFTMANGRAQGTAIGSVYGVMCCFLFSHEGVRLFAILPWIIVTSFARYSKMYGQTVGSAAATGALLILGRKNYGVPDEFAIARLTEVFIGLLAFIVVELFVQPIRATTLAKNHFFTTLHALKDYIKETGICPLQNNKTMPKFLELREKKRHLDFLICELKELIRDAELEPDFWYLPFRTSSYQKLVKSLSNIRDLLHFITYNFEIISDLLETTTLRKEFQEQINDELELLQETLNQATSTESQAVSKEPIDGICEGLEAGVLQNIITEHKEVEWTTQDEETEENKMRELIMRHVSATGFCISSILQELKDIEICLREINQWENQSTQ